MCEGIGEDLRHGAWHVDIHVEICRFLLNVCGCVNMELHVHLGGGYPLLDIFSIGHHSPRRGKKCFQVLDVHPEVETFEV